MMAGTKRTSRLAAPDIRGQDISQDLCVYRGISRHRYMPKFGVALEIDVFQQSAKMLAFLHRFSDPVREIEIFQPMDIGRNGISGHRIERDDQGDLYSRFLEGLGDAERCACSKGMPDQHDRGYSPAFAVLQCFPRQVGGERMIGDRRADVSFAQFVRQLIDAWRQHICKPAQQVDLFASMQRPERLGMA
jgi:hypothetical protein